MFDVKVDDDARYVLRDWRRETDADSLVRHANDENVARYMRAGFPWPYTPESARVFFDIVQRDPEFSRAVVRVTADGAEEAIGAIGLKRGPLNDIDSHAAEIGYWLGRPYWRRGIITATIGAFMTHYIPAGVTRVFAVVATDNVASSRALMANGFEVEGVMKRYGYRFGRYYDATMLARILER
ncbi:N-acetyltransferase domain-containing protein [Plasmodiophora brassicae]